MKTNKNLLEWIVFAVCALLLLALVTALIITGRDSGDTPPQLTVTTGAPVGQGGVFRVPVEIRNSGDITAEQAHIEIALMSGDEMVERAELTMDFVPRRSQRSGWVTFDRDPRCCSIRRRALGYQEP